MCTNGFIQYSNSSLDELYEHSYPPTTGNTSRKKNSWVKKPQVACLIIGDKSIAYDIIQNIIMSYVRYLFFFVARSYASTLRHNRQHSLYLGNQAQDPVRAPTSQSASHSGSISSARLFMIPHAPGGNRLDVVNPPRMLALRTSAP